jgi:6-phosphogluconolactonase
MNADVRIFATSDELFRAAAETFAETARAAIAARGAFTVALAGGSTPRALYERLASPPYREAVTWRNVEWFWGDERAVGPDDPQSNYRLAREALLAQVDVDPLRVHRLRGEATPLTVAAEEYERELSRVFAVAPAGPPPSVDLVLLGMGDDGHTASLFPDTAALDERRRWVAANDVPQLRTQRLTMTYPLLNAASLVVFLVTGEAKAEMLREVLQGPYDPRRLPGQAVQPAGRTIWFIDRTAASRLE